ncbi:MAG: J domain-containing protein [Pseudomonadales bacterium]|nr:J domain-containing protein [Pseudomonadales bacterium]
MLNIAPTRDAREIKRAYALRLKTTRPDDDPAAFQSLRKAYEWALAQCAAQPVPPAVVYLQIKSSTPTFTPHEQATPEPFEAPPAELQTAPQGHPTVTHAPIPQAPSPILGAQHWQTFRSTIESLANDDCSRQRINLITEQLRTALRHEDLINFEAREAFVDAALTHCADASTPNALRLACDAVFDWTHAPMPLAPSARWVWSGVIERITSDQQYREMQTMAKHNEGRAWVLQQLTQSEPPQIPWLRFLDKKFLNDVRDSLRRLDTSWSLALRFHLNASLLPTLKEMAERPWITHEALGGIGIAAIWAFIAMTTSMVDPDGQWPSLLAIVKFFSLPAVGIALLVGLLIAYPLWIVPPLRRLQRRVAASLTQPRQWRDRHPTLWVAWYVLRIGLPTLLFLSPWLPPWYAELLSSVIIAVMLLHLVVMVLVDGWRKSVLFLLASFLCLGFLPTVFSPFYTFATPQTWLLMVVLAKTLLFDLHIVLQQVYGRSWDTARMRLILLACIVILAPLQFLLADQLLVFAALLGWAWVIVACATTNVLGWESLYSANRLQIQILAIIYWLAVLWMAAFLLEPLENLATENALAGILALEIMVAGISVFTLLANDLPVYLKRIHLKRTQQHR